MLLGLLACTSGNDSPHKVELVTAPALADVAPFVAQQLEAAAHDHKKLIVYVGANWCEPCRRFRNDLAAGRFDHDFGTLRLLAFDSDRDIEALYRAGYRFQNIPMFAVPNHDGTGGTHQIEGTSNGLHDLVQ